VDSLCCFIEREKLEKINITRGRNVVLD